MITLSDLAILQTEATQEAIERNIEREHTAVALDKSLCHSSLVASQVKYLQRARHKLPALYAVRGVIPSRAYEQSSSEATAAHKRISGSSVLELTCGLGVDTAALATRFKRVVTLERDEVLARVAQENFRRLGLTNIEVVRTSAEEYLSHCNEHFDWIYADPDRRSADGRKQVLLECCSPNMIALKGDIERISSRVSIKCSPLFDVDEAMRIYPDCRVESVSVGDECKEVVIYINPEEPSGEVGATAIGKGEVWVKSSDRNNYTTPQSIDTEQYTTLIIPDVALQKSRMARHIMSEVADIWSENGFAFMRAESQELFDPSRHLGRRESIEWIGEYNPKQIRKELAQRGIKSAEILKRDTPLSVAQITKQLKISEGGRCKIAVTKLQNQTILAILSR